MKIIISLLLAMLLVACNKNDAAKPVDEGSPKPTESPKKSLDDRVNDLELDKLFRTWDKIAYLKIGGEGYSLIQFDLGVLTIKIKDVQPYANSSKVQLEIGNPLGATITGLKMTVQWGSTNEKGHVLEELGSKEVTVDKNILAGSWNSVNITLDSTDPKKLGFVRIRDVSHTGIILTKAR